MAKPSAIAQFIKAQRADMKKSASPSFEEISDNAVTIQRDQPSFDNGELAELRRTPAPGSVNMPDGDKVELNLPAGADLNPGVTKHNQASPGPEKSASANAAAIVAAVRASLGIAPATEVNKSAAVATAAPAAPAPLSQADLSNDILLKVAHIMTATEEGCRAAEYFAAKSTAVDDAKTFMKQAVAAKQFIDTNEMHKAAAVNTTLGRAHAIENYLRQNGVTDEFADICIKQASIHEHNLGVLDHPMLKRAYAEGVDDQAAMEGALEQGGDPAIPGGDEQISEEEILALLQEMVASGEITIEEVQQAIAELTEGGGQEAAAATVPAQ